MNAVTAVANAVSTPHDYVIADLSLAAWGRKEIAIAETEMPGLMAIREEFATAQPLRGTRITVELILEKLAAGQSEEQILRAHPRLSHEAILAALGFAAQALRSDVVYPFERVAS